jgi:rubrerythrin
MATFVGKQADLADLLKSLLELEYDAVAAYSSAIARLDELSFKLKFEQFRSDHERHIRTLADALLQLGVDPPEHADAKVIVTRGKVVVGTLAGDRGILLAMRSNEDDTNTAYARAVARGDLGSELHLILSQGLADERRHRAWIDDQLDTLDGSGSNPAGEPALGAN